MGKHISNQLEYLTQNSDYKLNDNLNNELEQFTMNKNYLGFNIQTFGAENTSINIEGTIKGPKMNIPPNSSDYNYYKCPSCIYFTQKRDKLDKHIQRHVIYEGYHPCGKKRQKTNMPAKRHKHNPEEYECPLCPYTCTVSEAYKKHLKIHVSGENPVKMKVSCKICGKDRSDDLEMKEHMKKHKNKKYFLCDLCNFRNFQLKKIIQHRRMHTGEKPHLCPHCNYRSSRRDNLRSHVRRMHGKENMYIDTFNPKGNKFSLEDSDDLL
ncbi:zinc finger protein 121-like [Centruroides vittatus]|uniref:zinc finger protein 121-like n=1 Tax=Centruroides vittatus TaxID=120091 RepID=UPI0035104BBF